MEIVLGQEVYLNGRQYQNYDFNSPNFLPFAFSGVAINRNGDNVSAALVFPNSDLSRPWVSEAIDSGWVVTVIVKNLSPEVNLYAYVGQVSSGGWDEQVVNLQLNTVLDAVGSDVPFRSLSEDLVGPLPSSANVRVF
jgi:hypothetical protein